MGIARSWRNIGISEYTASRQANSARRCRPPQGWRSSFTSQPSRQGSQHLLRARLCHIVFHHGKGWSTLGHAIRCQRHVRTHAQLRGALGCTSIKFDPMSRHRKYLRFLFVFGYAWQGCVWLYCSGIAPLEYRYIGGAYPGSGQCLVTFINIFARPIGLTNIWLKFWL